VAPEIDGDDAPVGETLGERAIALPMSVDAVEAEDRCTLRVAPLVRVKPQSSVSSVSSPAPDGR
jgi:hypothetical protein